MKDAECKAKCIGEPARQGSTRINRCPRWKCGRAGGTGRSVTRRQAQRSSRFISTDVLGQGAIASASAGDEEEA